MLFERNGLINGFFLTFNPETPLCYIQKLGFFRRRTVGIGSFLPCLLFATIAVSIIQFLLPI